MSYWVAPDRKEQALGFPSSVYFLYAVLPVLIPLLTYLVTPPGKGPPIASPFHSLS